MIFKQRVPVMLSELLIATSNKHKIAEIAAILAEAGLTGVRLLGLDAYPGFLPPEEDGDTFAANSAIKARAAAVYSGLPALADDSGLAVEALGGAPGVYSARYAGPAHDAAANRRKLLEALAKVPAEQRQAAFVCAVTLALPQPDGSLLLRQSEGRCRGSIAFMERGEQGFGYDSLFITGDYGRHMAELDPERKNRISHRGRALRGMVKWIKEA